MTGDYEDAGVEPAPEELLADPIVRALLERDGIDPAAVRSLLASIRERLQDADVVTPPDQPRAA
jgi:hypothetical protein